MTPGAVDTAKILARLSGRRATWLEIDLDALGNNLQAIAEACGQRRVWAVVKADAYGHGAVRCAKTLLAAGAAGLVVALPEEASVLRQAGIDAPVLLSGPLAAGGAGRLIEEGVTVSISSIHDLGRLESAAACRGRVAGYHLEIDTGMTRMGLADTDITLFLDAMQAAPHTRLEGVASHLAPVRDAGGPVARQQLERLRGAMSRVHSATAGPVPTHLASSPALCALPEAFLDAVRPGLLLYGIRPHRDLQAPPGIRPVLAWRAAVALVRDVPAGTSIGYDGTYQTATATRVAVLAAGYADGLRKAVADTADALLDGCRHPYRGTVNMDLAQIDLGAGATGQAEQIATLVGRDGDDTVSVEELAERTGHSAYEWLTGLGGRLPRVYIERGEPIAVYTPLQPSLC